MMHTMRALLISLGATLFACTPADRPPPPAAHAPAASRTHWEIEPSQAYDAIAIVNLLTGDPFYVDRGYRAEYERFSAHLGELEKKAIASLVHQLKEEGHQMIYPSLAYFFSGGDVTSLADLIRQVDDNQAWAALERNYLASNEDNRESLPAIQSVRPVLRTLFAYLHAEGFEAFWTENALPRVRAYIEQNGAFIRGYDVVGKDEEVLGRRLPVETLTAYVMAYGRPHGVRVQGWRFLTDVSYKQRTVVKTALHELLHPPFKREGELDRLLRAFANDPYFQRLVHEHNPSFGYNSAEGLIEEDCVNAIDVYNTTRFGLMDDVPSYFRDHDDGIHVLAFVLERRLAASGRGPAKTYEEFVAGMLKEIAAAGGLQRAFEALPEHYAIKAWQKS